MGQPGGATVTALVADGSGNFYVTGTFVGTTYLGGVTLTSTGAADVYVAKYNVGTNNFVWGQRIGSAGTDQVYGLAFSGNSVYVAGTFAGSTVTAGSISLTNAGSGRDIFVAKLTDVGTGANVVWATRAGGNANDDVYRMALNGSNLYLAGYTTSTDLVWGSTVLPNSGSSDVFVGKLVDNGSSPGFGWALQGGGNGTDEAYGIAVNGSSVYVAGAAASSVLTFGSTTLMGAGSYDGFIAKIADAGATASYVWAQRVGGSAADGLSAVAATGGSVYVAGAFASAGLVVGGTSLTTAGGNDVLAVKYTDAGSSASVAWATTAGGTADDFVYNMLEYAGSLYFTGYFGGSVYSSSIGSSTANFGSQTLTSVGNGDAFVARLSGPGASAVFNYAQQAGGAGSDAGRALAVTGSGRLYVGGSFSGQSATFGSQMLTNSTNSETGFLAYLLDPILATVPSAAPISLIAYPNPAHGAATVRIPASAGAASLVLLDALGRVIRTASAPAGQEYPFDLIDLAPGVYTLRVRGGEATATCQLVVE